MINHLKTLLITFAAATIICGCHSVQQPDLSKWKLITTSMTEGEVLKILGPPMSKSLTFNQLSKIEQLALGGESTTYSYNWIYGHINLKSTPLNYNHDFSIWFVDGKVVEICDPFESALSADGRPTTPKLIQPLNGQSLDHYPRYMDFRWQISSGDYPLQYEIQCDRSNGPEKWLEEFTKQTHIPYAAHEWCGMNEGRWRVRAINDKGEGEWSEYYYFKFLK